MTRERPAHYIKENAAARVPSRVVVIDVQAQETRVENGSEFRWQCGTAVFIHWTNRGIRHETVERFDSAARLWDMVDGFTRPKKRTVLYAHNIPFVIRVADGMGILPGLGYVLDNVRLGHRGSWQAWSKSGITLCVADTASIFPTTVQALSHVMGFEGRIPDESWGADWLAERSAWLASTLARVIVDYLEWLKTGAAGNWQMTGAGQSWSHWRHCHYTHKILVHDDVDALDAERRAMWTGRAEAYRWGKSDKQPAYEYDWQNAYPRVARDEMVPTQLMSRVGKLSIKDMIRVSATKAVLCDVHVVTDKPVLPTRVNGKIAWPIGEFDTTVWDVEAKEAVNAGATLNIQRAWIYRKDYALRDWAEWCIGVVGGKIEPDKPWLPIAAKHWSRALIGRFATRYQDWEPLATGVPSGLSLGTLIDVNEGTVSDTMTVGTTIYKLTGFRDGGDACPQITSYIMAVQRAKLWRVLSAISTAHVLYCDTDSVIVDLKGHAIIERMKGQGDYAGLRIKGRYIGYEIFGPRCIVMGDKPVIAGCPRGAIRVSQQVWIGTVWQSMDRAIRMGVTDHARATERKYTAKYSDSRRERIPGGKTIPYSVPISG